MGNYAKHAAIGGEVLGKSELRVLKIASRLACYHHEKWDGTGYPEKFKW